MSQIIIFYCINFACTITTNFTLLVFMLNNRKLRTPSNTFLMSELLAGLLFELLYILPRNILKVTFDELTICKIFTYLGVLFVICINLHVCAISFDRFFAVVFPFRYRQIASKRTSLLICGTMWFISLLVCIVPIITFDRETETCLSRPRFINRTNATALTTNLTTIQSTSAVTISNTLSPLQALISSWKIYLLFVLFVFFCAV